MSNDVIYLSLIGFFAIIFLMTNAFWLYQYNRLLNKFMSRNYAEFVQAEAMGLPQQELQLNNDELPDAYGSQRANELNSLMGFGVQEVEQ